MKAPSYEGAFITFSLLREMWTGGKHIPWNDAGSKGLGYCNILRFRFIDNHNQ